MKKKNNLTIFINAFVEAANNFEESFIGRRMGLLQRKSEGLAMNKNAKTGKPDSMQEMNISQINVQTNTQISTTFQANLTGKDVHIKGYKY